MVDYGRMSSFCEIALKRIGSAKYSYEAVAMAEITVAALYRMTDDETLHFMLDQCISNTKGKSYVGISRTMKGCIENVQSYCMHKSQTQEQNNDQA